MNVLSDPTGPHWGAGARASVERMLAADANVVVSILGCHVDVLDRCRIVKADDGDGGKPADQDHVSQLEGECTNATHIARPAAPGNRLLHLSPLSLRGVNLTGTWRGVMRQPRGPYEAYDATLELVHEGDRVTGITRLSTTDGQYWGDLRFEGKVEGNTILFADSEIIDDNLGISFLGWCLKSGYMLVEPNKSAAANRSVVDHMHGPWRASLCASGTLDVHFVGENQHILAQTIPR